MTLGIYTFVMLALTLGQNFINYYDYLIEMPAQNVIVIYLDEFDKEMSLKKHLLWLMKFESDCVKNINPFIF